MSSTDVDYRDLFYQFKTLVTHVGRELLELREQWQEEDLAPRELARKGDLYAEGKIRRKIEELVPNDNILGEEEGLKWTNSPYTWVIDPIDGSTNFSNGVPHWAVSLALCRDGYVEYGVVYLPRFSLLYSAIKGNGALRNGVSLQVPPKKEYRSTDLIGTSSNIVQKSFPMGKLRKLGSVVIDLLYLAEGKFITIFEPETHVWDMAAAYLIAREAGCEVYGYDQKKLEPFDLKSPPQPFPLIGKSHPSLPHPEWR